MLFQDDTNTDMGGTSTDTEATDEVVTPTPVVDEDSSEDSSEEVAS